MTANKSPVTIVSGASGGIGAAVISKLAQLGHSLVLNGLEEEILQRQVRNIAENGGAADALAGDAGDRSLPKKLCALALKRFGRIDGLVTGAGISWPKPLVDLADEDWDRLIDINLSFAFRLSREVSREMISQGGGGAIVHISSIAHANGGANLAYGAAKGGVATLTFGMAQQLGPHGIRVNAVAPGVIDTPLVRRNFSAQFEALRRGASARTPLGRIGQPDDVANVIAFLLSADAAFVTGALIPVTGGIEILPPISALPDQA
jgi:3-oxoacyl-[acyl-carrier protein] reductase